jgi:large subunit ribosomal protein L28
MAQVCDVCGKGPQFGNNISHAHNVTRRRWNPNLQAVRALVNGASKRIRVCTSCIRAVRSPKSKHFRWLPYPPGPRLRGGVLLCPRLPFSMAEIP